MLRALDVQPSTTIDLAGIEALTGFGPARARRGVDALVRAHLASLEDRWVHQHDLLAAYARACAGELLPVEQQRMLIALADDLLVRTEAACDTWERRIENAHFTEPESARDWLLHALTLIVDVADRLPVSADATVVAFTRWLHLVLLRVSAHELADRLIGKAAAAAERLGDLSAQARAVGALGTVLHRRGEVQAGVEHLVRAQALALRSGDPQVRAVVANNLGVLRSVAGQLQEALALYREALALAVELDDAERIRVATTNIGSTLIELGSYDEAEVLLRARYDVDREGGFRSRLAYSACYLAELALARGDDAAAAALANESIELAREHANLIMESTATRVLGQTAIRSGDGVRAAAILETALELARRTNEVDQIAASLAWLARAVVDAEPDRALRLVDESLARTRRDGLVPVEIQAVDAQAFVLRRLGRSAEAERAEQLAAQLREQCGIV